MFNKKKTKQVAEQAETEQPIRLVTQTTGDNTGSAAKNHTVNNKPKKESWLRFYDELTLATQLQEDNKSSFCTQAKSPHNGVSIDLTAMVAGDEVTYFYYVNKMPQHLPINYRTQLRQACDKSTRIAFIDLMRPHKMDMNSSKMRAKLRVLAQIGGENDNKDINAYNMHENIEEVQRQEWVEESLMYFSEASALRGCGMLKGTMVVQITGKRSALFDNSVKKVLECASRLGITLTRIMYDIPDTLSAVSPFSHNVLPDIERNMPVNVFTDEIASRFTVYSQGVTGHSGLYFGSDVRTGSPVLKTVKRTKEDAEVWLITAQTGGGKSFFSKFLILELVAMGCNCTILDVEGKEYLYMANFLSHNSKVLVVNLGEGTGRYFDPVAIAPPTGDKEIDADSRKMSMDCTVAMFKVLLGRMYDDSIWYDTVISDTVAYTYSNAGVTDDPKTWSKSRNLTLHNVYNNLSKLLGTQNNTEYDKAINSAITMLKKYFTPDGVRAELFRNRISIGEIADADFVICSFGMAGRDPSTVDETQMALMQLGAAQLSHQRSIFSRARGKYNVKVWEEVQRWGSFKNAVSVLKTAITGGRKLGDISIVITNDPGSLLANDPFALMNNSTAKFIGKLDDTKIIHDLCDTLAVSELESELLQITKAATNKVGGSDAQTIKSPYEHAFLCVMGGGNNAVTRMEIPKAIAKLPVFYTGV